MKVRTEVSTLLMNGDELASRNEQSEALKLYDRVLTLDPENTRALERKAIVLVGQGRRDEALRCQAQLVALDPNNPQRRVDHANLSLMVGDIDGAVTALREAVRTSPSNPRMLQRLGDAYRTGGHAHQALDVYDRALTIAPEDGAVWAAKADALIEAGRAEEAVSALERAALLDPQFSELDWILRADRCYILHDYERAAQLYRKAIDARPSVVSWRGLGLTAQAVGDITEALQCYEAALRLEPDNAQILNDRGYLLMQLHRTPEAQVCFQRVVEMDRDSVDGWMNLGWTYTEMSQWQEAHGAFTHAARVDPDRADAWLQLGICEMQLGEDEAAMRRALMSFDRAAELDDDMFWAWSNAGEVLNRLAKYEEAMVRVDRAIELDVAEPIPWSIKAELLLRQGRVADAQRCMDEMITAAADRGHALKLKAGILTDSLGRDNDALELMLEASRLQPDDEGLDAGIAETLLKVGRYAEARTKAEHVSSQTKRALIRCVMLFVVWASHVLENGTSEARAAAFTELMEQLRKYIGAPRELGRWNYEGLKRAIRDTPNAESQFLLALAIDSLEGTLPVKELPFFAGDSEFASTG